MDRLHRIIVVRTMYVFEYDMCYNNWHIIIVMWCIHTYSRIFIIRKCIFYIQLFIKKKKKHETLRLYVYM